MRKFDYKKLATCKWDSTIVEYIAKIHEMKGRQELYLKQKQLELDRLVEIAKIQSTEASNAIEGIGTSETRLKQLISQKTTPKNRDEKEIAGYRDALSTIHESFEYIPITPNYILQLHKILYSHNTEANFGGCFKNAQNEISAVDEKGNKTVLFVPLSPFETPMAIDSLCRTFNEAIDDGKVDALILIPIFIHDFLCIHPFRDGNGRMSRLLTTLLLYRSGYFVGKYISLESKIAKYKDLYYDALYDSQIGWHEGKDDPTPFIKYLLMTILSAYNDFEERLSLVGNKKSATELVEGAFRIKIGKLTKSDIAELCPTISVSAVEKGISVLIKGGKVKKFGQGKNTYYVLTE